MKRLALLVLIAGMVGCSKAKQDAPQLEIWNYHPGMYVVYGEVSGGTAWIFPCGRDEKCSAPAVPSDVTVTIQVPDFQIREGECLHVDQAKNGISQIEKVACK